MSPEQPLHLLWVGHCLFPSFPCNQNEKETMSIIIPTVHEIKTDLLLKRMTTILGTKIRQEFLLGGLLKGTRCEVMSKHPSNIPPRVTAVSSSGAGSVMALNQADGTAPKHESGKDILARRGLRETNWGVQLTAHPTPPIHTLEYLQDCIRESCTSLLPLHRSVHRALVDLAGQGNSSCGLWLISTASQAWTVIFREA